MLQLTSRRFLRELDEAPEGNNLQYILKCPCIPFFGNQGLHNKIVLGGNGERSGVMCEGAPYRVAVKALLNSGATGLFMDTAFTKEKRFKMEKLKNLLLVRNVDGMENVGGAITHQVECNMFFKGHIERIRIDMCNLGKTEVILGMLWLAAHNPEIDWEKGEVRMTRCPPICGKKKQERERKEVKKVETDEDKEVLRKLVPKRFWR